MTGMASPDISRGGTSGEMFKMDTKDLEKLRHEGLKAHGSVSVDLGTDSGSFTTDAAVAMGVEDLNPTPDTPACRDYTWVMFSTMWTSVLLSPTSVSVGAALLAMGLNWWEALVAHFIGSMVTVGGLILMAWPGVQYGIPFPVLARSAFGLHGAHFSTLSRGAVAVMWLSFNMWQGALGLYTGIGVAAGKGFMNWVPIAGQGNLTLAQLLLLIGFGGCHGLLIAGGLRKSLKRLMNFAILFQSGLLLGVLIWACRLVPIQQTLPNEKGTGSAIGWMEAINATTCVWSTLILNVADFSRYCPTQKDQVVGQLLGFPVQYTFVGWIGLVAAGATSISLGTQMWQIPEYFSVWSAPWAIIGSIVLALAVLVCNCFANMLSPMNDLMNLAPSKFNFRYCGYICVAAAIGMCPWITFGSQNTFVTTFLSGYGMVTGSLAGIMITDFHLVRRRILFFGDLYPKGYKAADGSWVKPEGRPPTFDYNCNWRAVLALFAGIVPCIPGFALTLNKGLGMPVAVTHLYSVSFFYALGASSFVLYWCTWAFPPLGFSRAGYKIDYSYEAAGVQLDNIETAKSMYNGVVSKITRRNDASSTYA